MRWFGSLRLRMLVFAMAGILAALAIAGMGLGALFERHLERRLAQELDGQIDRLAGNLRVREDGVLGLAETLDEQQFSRVFSGHYWQVRDEQSGALLRSPSLWDSALATPMDALVPGEVHEHQIEGPDGDPLILRESIFLVSHEGKDHAARISAAMSRQAGRELTLGFARDMVPALGLLAAVLLVGAWFQVSAGLAPVGKLSARVKDIREGRTRHLENPAANEVQPLVDELNTLLQQQREDIGRARDRAADLAHGLKTPLTALAADVAALRRLAHERIAGSVEEVADQMARTVERELARSRLRNSATGEPIVLASNARAIIRTLSRTPAGERMTYTIKGDEAVAARANADDVNDILGNLLENAARHATSAVVVELSSHDGKAVTCIRDDGPGGDLESMARLSQRGMRSDRKGGSAGLGLAIVSDIAGAYGAQPEFGVAPEGGLAVTIRLPLALSPASR